MKTIWALAGALCLVAGFAQAAPTADVVQDVANGVNQISEKSAEVPILSSEVEVDVATPFLVSRVSTILTAATPAIYQDAAQNPHELSERLVKPVTLLLNSVSGGVTTLAKDNSRRFFVPSFVRFNFRQDALLELDRIRRTERFWNETEQYVDSVCARLKKYIDTQRRRGSQAASAATTTSSTTTTTVAPSSASTSVATGAPARLSASVHVAIKAERPVSAERGDLKLSIHEAAAPIKIPTAELPDRRSTAKPVHQALKPTSESVASVQVVPSKEPAAEVIAPKPVESIETTSAAPSAVPVQTTPLPSKVEPTTTSTEKVPETTVAAAATTETARSAAVTEKVPSPVDVKVPEELSSDLVVAESVPVAHTVSAAPVVTPKVESPSAAIPKSEPVPAVASRTESAPEAVPTVVEKTPEVPQAGTVAIAASRTENVPSTLPDKQPSPPAASARAEPSVVVVPESEAVPVALPAVDAKTIETLQPVPTTVAVSPAAVETPVVTPVDVKPTADVTTPEVPSVDATSAAPVVKDAVAPVTETAAVETASPVDVKSVPVSPEPAVLTEPVAVPSSVVDPVPAVSQKVSEPVVDAVVETVSSVAPQVVSTAATVPDVAEPSTAATVQPVVQSAAGTPVLQSAPEVPSVAAQASEPVPVSVLPESAVAHSSAAPVTVETSPVPEVVTPTETPAKADSVVTTSTEAAVTPSTEATVAPQTTFPAVETSAPVEESHTTVSHDVTTVQHSVVSSSVRPTTGEVHRVHPVASTIVFPSKAPPKISQSVNVAQVSSYTSHENPVSYVSSTTVTTSRSDSSKATVEALRFEQVALSHPIVIRPVKSPLPIAIPHRVIKHSPDGVSVVKTQGTGPVAGQVSKGSR